MKLFQTLALALAMLPAAVVAAEPGTSRPNIVFIFSDDHATHSISAYGSKINQTPNIDRIARQGMIFRNAFCANSICSPSRASILTGKYSHMNGVYNVNDWFDGTQQTFPRLLQKAGYQTALIGKWHLSSNPTGFDYWNILMGQGPYYNPPMIENGQRTNHIGYTTDIITDQSLQWLEERRDPDKPFMLMFQHKSPHRPWDPDPKHFRLFDEKEIPEPDNLFDDYATRASAARDQKLSIARDINDRDVKIKAPPELTPEQRKEWDAYYDPILEDFKEKQLAGKELTRWKYQRYIKDYLRVVAAMDDNIGRMLDYLEKSGLSKNTVVIYSSDQGFFLGDHGFFDKRFMYEESMRMPLIVNWPGVTEPGSENRGLVQNIDFAQTFLDIAGARIPGDMQGRSIVPLLKGQTPDNWRKSLYYHYYEHPSRHIVYRHYGVRTDRHKLISYYDRGEWELFDLEKDPRETNNVYDNAAYANVRDELKVELKRLQTEAKEVDPDVPNKTLRAMEKELRARQGGRRRR